MTVSKGYEWVRHASLMNAFSYRDPDGYYLADCGYACGGLGVKEGVVVESAPIFKWAKGQDFSKVKRWRKWRSIKSIDGEEILR